MWVSRRELSRIEREALDARKRACEAERRLAEERAAKDKLALALLDHVAVRDKGYPLSTRMPQPEVVTQPESEEQFRERLKSTHPLWPFYQQSALDAGKSEDDALDALAKLVRGEPLPFEQEGTM